MIKYFAFLWLPILVLAIAIFVTPVVVLSAIAMALLAIVFTVSSLVGLAVIGGLVFEYFGIKVLR